MRPSFYRIVAGFGKGAASSNPLPLGGGRVREGVPLKSLKR
jgi:hypothetical protein